jgi:hypothetical protein
LDPAQIQSVVDDTHRQNYKMAKAKATDPVIKALKDELEDFKEQLPLVQEVLLCLRIPFCTAVALPSHAGNARY